MREINYKAYIRKINKIVDVYCLNLMAKEAYFSNWVDIRRPWISFSELDLMEGTGINDMYGREIFEGFKVKAENVKTRNEGVYTVLRINGAFVFHDAETKNIYNYDDLLCLDIVGSIYMDDSESAWDNIVAAERKKAGL